MKDMLRFQSHVERTKLLQRKLQNKSPKVFFPYYSVLHESEMQTICAKLKHIKREIKIPEEQFIQQMRFLLEKGKLPSDNKIAPLLMSYNILRDNQSEYVFNGKFMFNVFQMAYKQYLNDLKHFYGDKSNLFEEEKFDSSVASRQEQQKPHNKISN